MLHAPVYRIFMVVAQGLLRVDARAEAVDPRDPEKPGDFFEKKISAKISVQHFEIDADGQVMRREVSGADHAAGDDSESSSGGTALRP
jgi:hypothetical protein